MKNLLLVIAGLIASLSIQAQTVVDRMPPSIEKVKTFSFKNNDQTRDVVYVTVAIKRPYNHCFEGIKLLRDFKGHSVAVKEMNRDSNGNPVALTTQNIFVSPLIDSISTIMPIEVDPVTGETIPRVCTADVKYISGERTIKFDIIPGADININTYDDVEFVGLSFAEVE